MEDLLNIWRDRVKVDSEFLTDQLYGNVLRFWRTFLCLHKNVLESDAVVS